MTKAYTILILLAVFGNLDRIKKSLEKGDYDKSLDLIEKGLSKDPNNSGLYFYKAALFYDTLYHGYQLDSARQFIAKALALHAQLTTEEQEEELSSEGITPEKLDSLKAVIRDKTYSETLQSISIEKIDTFYQLYPQSIYYQQLEHKKDSLLFLSAKEQGTIHSYENYIAQRPTSSYASLADSLRNCLAFEQLTDQPLEAYYSYLEKHPASAQRPLAEAYIFKHATPHSSLEEYRDFLKIAETPFLRKQTLDILFYLGENPRYLLDQHTSSDSLKSVFEREKGLFPILENGLFGFSSLQSEQSISPAWQDISEQDKCQLIMDDWILVRNGTKHSVISSEGRLVISEADSFQTLTYGIALVQQKGKRYVYHKSGFRLSPEPVDQAAVIGRQWIKIKQEEKWGLLSVAGKTLLPSVYDDIYRMDDLWVLKRDSKLALMTDQQFQKTINTEDFSPVFEFEEVETITEGYILGVREDQECLLDADLNVLVPWGKHEINPFDGGWYLRSEQGYSIQDQQFNSLISDPFYAFLETNTGWIALKTNSDWVLISKTQKTSTRGYDSLKLVNAHAALAFVDGNAELIFQNDLHITTDKKLVRTFPENDEYLIVKDTKYSQLLDSTGAEIFRKVITGARFLNDSLLVLEYEDKKGVYNVLQKDYLIKLEYHYIDMTSDLILLLKDKKFGAYDLAEKALIPTRYDQKITKANNHYIVAQGGMAGVIHANGNVIVPFEYEKIDAWGDSTFLTKTASEYQLTSPTEGTIEHFESMEKVFENNEQSIWRFLKGGKYGLISSSQGVILKPEFTDIVNIGQADMPLFVADQNLYTAKYHVVSYVDLNGKVIKSIAYREEEFDKILCDKW